MGGGRSNLSRSGIFLTSLPYSRRTPNGWPSSKKLRGHRRTQFSGANHETKKQTRRPPGSHSLPCVRGHGTRARVLITGSELAERQFAEEPIHRVCPLENSHTKKKKKRKAFLLIFTRPAETCQVAFSPGASIGPRESPAEGPRLCRGRTRPPSRLLCGGTRHVNCHVPLKATRPRDWPRQRPPEQTVPKAREPPTPGPGLCRRHPQPRGDTDTARWWHGRAGSVVATLHREPAPGALHVGVFIPGVRAPDSVASPVGGISRGWGAAAEWQAPSQAVWNRGEGSGEAPGRRLSPGRLNLSLEAAVGPGAWKWAGRSCHVPLCVISVLCGPCSFTLPGH